MLLKPVADVVMPEAVAVASLLLGNVVYPMLPSVLKKLAAAGTLPMPVVGTVMLWSGKVYDGANCSAKLGSNADDEKVSKRIDRGMAVGARALAVVTPVKAETAFIVVR